MTTPKPASAPQADAFEIARDLQEALASNYDAGCCNATFPIAYARRLSQELVASLAASAQVREVEPLGVCKDYPNCPNLGCGPRCDRNAKFDPQEGHADNCHAMHPGDRECNCHKAYGFDTAEDMQEADEADKPAAEPVTVAQGIERFNTVCIYEDSGYPCASMFAVPEGEYVRYADHARREASLESELAECADGIERLLADKSDLRSDLTKVEASLAACRADAERYRWLRDPMEPLRDALCADDLCADELDAAIDALRKEAA